MSYPTACRQAYWMSVRHIALTEDNTAIRGRNKVEHLSSVVWSARSAVRQAGISQMNVRKLLLLTAKETATE